MKLIAFLLAMPALAFGTTCYKAETATPYKVPSVLCLESIVDGTTYNQLDVVSLDGSFPAALKITETSRHNEDRLNFKAEAVLVDIWESGCGDGISAKLNVKGQLAYGEISAESLAVSVDTEVTNDTCHSHPWSETINYKLVK
ncbi:hypothetical protein DOM21_16895 [Bacteriovorax stolpii]|uniref:Uncharacterized protein n=1 Tax=Bacteriovorax stolpii TaxID=960 RepID=A0A2K9NN70_BACTC|nr:hypothetical protein [Bacteriovorax stolpii]AUN96969.1 hypothetical protein C0V70_02375 [Bacteriovorax stolpii]QDK43101.1 hypothetical protein DOM21_16895 [Bacteriovorax stolpii]TDP53252.1 hypothetical protein C8D79_1894 [Bacteriovorax stolpii]